MKKFEGKVLVVGATGRTGLWVIRRLQHYGIEARAFARKADKLAEFRNLEVSLGKIQNASALRSAVSGCSAIICTIGASELIGEALLFKWTAMALFVLSILREKMRSRNLFWSVLSPLRSHFTHSTYLVACSLKNFVQKIIFGASMAKMGLPTR